MKPLRLMVTAPVQAPPRAMPGGLHRGLRRHNSRTPGSALDPRGRYHLVCPGVLEVVPGTKGEATCTLSSTGFKGPVTLDCGSSDGLICTEPNGVVVNLGLNQQVPVKFYVDVPVGAVAGPYTLFVRHDGDASPKLPMPYLLQVMVPNMLPPCETALPLNCYMDPSRIVPTQT